MNVYVENFSDEAALKASNVIEIKDTEDECYPAQRFEQSKEEESDDDRKNY
jgi:hypothetical protein